MTVLGASGSSRNSELLIDTDLLVLYTVGTVNRSRIENFKRTCQYSERDYGLLLRVIQKLTPLYTVAHVMADVSNLIDLSGREQSLARHVLKEMLSSYKNRRCRACEQRRAVLTKITDLLMRQSRPLHSSTNVRYSLLILIYIS